MDDKVLNLLEKIYIEVQANTKELRDGQKQLENRLDGLEEEIKKLGAKIDEDLSPKIEALLDGYKQNSEQLTRIENEIAKYDEFILKRVK